MNSSQTFSIKFQDEAVSTAGNKVKTLGEELNEISPDASAKPLQEDPENQDFGTTLVLVLGTPAIVAIAKGIGNYLSRVGGKITISKDGKMLAENISGKDVALIEKALASKKE